MKRFVPVFCAVLALALAGCSFFPPIVGSGRAITLDYAATGFSRVSASQACSVTVVPDTSWSLQVTCDDNLTDYVSVSRDSFGTLRIGLDPSHSYTGIEFKATVHTPSLSGLDLSGASRAAVGAGFVTAQTVGVTLSGTSTATLSSITCAGISADISGASSLVVGGSVGTVNLVVSGASSADLLGAAASSASVSLSGASNAKLDVGSGSIVLTASGASYLYYRGTPALTIVDLSGGSSIARIY